MALIIIRAETKADFDSKHPKLKLLSKKYDIIDVLDDGQDAGKKVCLPRYMILKVPGKTKKELEYLKEPNGTMEGDEFVKTEKRKYIFNFDSKLSPTDLTAIQESKEILIKDVNLSDVGEKL